MNTPNTSALMNIGTTALDGRDGDSARAAAQKFNTHYHEATTLADLSAYNTWQARPPKKGELVVYSGDLYIWTGTESIQIGSGGTELSADIQDALDQAALPSASNPFATMDDIPTDPFTTDQKAAITGAASPSALNVFATMDDIPSDPLSTDERAAIIGAASPSALNPFATMDDIPTVGTAAAKNVGTSMGDVVELGVGGKLPAVDGSLLTGLSTYSPSVAFRRLDDTGFVSVLSGQTRSSGDLVLGADEYPFALIIPTSAAASTYSFGGNKLTPVSVEYWFERQVSSTTFKLKVKNNGASTTDILYIVFGVSPLA